MAAIDLSAESTSLILEQGKSADIPFTISRQGIPLDLTDFIVRMQFRRSYKDSTVLLNATLSNGMVSWVNRAGGIFKIAIPPSATASATSKFKPARDEDDSINGVFDIELESLLTGVVYTPCKGDFTLNLEVTR